MFAGWVVALVGAWGELIVDGRMKMISGADPGFEKVRGAGGSEASF